MTKQWKKRIAAIAGGTGGLLLMFGLSGSISVAQPSQADCAATQNVPAVTAAANVETSGETMASLTKADEACPAPALEITDTNTEAASAGCNLSKTLSGKDQIPAQKATDSNCSKSCTTDACKADCAVNGCTVDDCKSGSCPSADGACVTEKAAAENSALKKNTARSCDSNNSAAGSCTVPGSASVSKGRKANASSVVEALWNASGSTCPSANASSNSSIDANALYKALCNGTNGSLQNGACIFNGSCK